MRHAPIVALMLIGLTLRMCAQGEIPTFKADVRGAFVWGEDAPTGAVSSTIRDPLTGYGILRLSHAGIGLSSQMGFEKVSVSEVGEFLGSTTTIVNDTDKTISVRYGGVSVDGRLATPLAVVHTDRNPNKRKPKFAREIVELDRLHCFSSGFLSSANFFSAKTSSQVFAVEPGAALTVSFVIRDPRNYSIRCSTEGCYPNGTIRSSVRVNSQDYVFVWPGRSLVSCGG